ncbi:MAG: RadC family protein [Candidatus Bipolaricaulota bacterium]
MSSQRIKDLPEYDRPREKLWENGVKQLTNSELLAVLIRSGGKNANALEVSRKLINDSDLGELAGRAPAELTDYSGIGQVKAAVIVAAFELAKRVASTDLSSGVKITGSQQVIEHLAPKMRHLDREEFWVLHLSNSNELLREVVLFKGSLDEMQISPREIVKSCLNHNSKAIILAHNHPNGDARPSEEDLRATEEIDQAVSYVGVEVLDHIILGRDDALSCRREELI